MAALAFECAFPATKARCSWGAFRSSPHPELASHALFAQRAEEPFEAIHANGACRPRSSSASASCPHSHSHTIGGPWHPLPNPLIALGRPRFDRCRCSASPQPQRPSVGGWLASCALPASRPAPSLSERVVVGRRRGAEQYNAMWARPGAVEGPWGWLRSVGAV